MVRARAFTLMEMLVAMALLLVLMGLASQVFKITLEGTGRLTQLSEVDRALRMFQERLTRELGAIDTGRGILAIQGNPAPAYWTDEQKQRDDDPADDGVFSGIAGQGFSVDPVRENPTLGRLCDHFVHALEVAGEDHVGIGSDFDGMREQLEPIPADISRLGGLFDALAARGVSEQVLAKVAGENFLRMLP